MKVQLICYSKCSTCKKAEKWLKENKIDFSKREIIEDIPTKEELKHWMNMTGKEIQKFFNTSGLKYKELHLKEKLPHMSEEEKLTLLSSDGMLIKRPILIAGDKFLLGFKEQEWKESIQ